MNEESYVIFAQVELFINSVEDSPYKAKFRTVNDVFKFELLSAYTGEIVFYSQWEHNLPPEEAMKAVDVIMYGSGYERKDYLP